MHGTAKISDPTTSECPSCRTPRMGAYCYRCGERFLTDHDFNLPRLLVHELPHELVHFDGKLGRTLRLLFSRPGFLAQEYVLGRRVGYVSPLRLYIVAFVLHALVGSLALRSSLNLPDRAAQIDPTGLVQKVIAARQPIDWQSPLVQSRQRQWGHWLSEGATMVLSFGVAFAQMVVFRRYHRRYLEHAILAMGVITAFVLLQTGFDLILIGTNAAQTGVLATVIQQDVGIVALIAYWFFSIRRFYGGSLKMELPATLVISAVQIVLSIALNILAMALIVAAM